ncbi:hypothetical protein GQ53DRAFT_423198 [Thozetella sp. PMI_491]|nr:hypothetical protein GQ53DRAFT_423198 [Thozetella sp. PMI_491]
MLSTRTNSAARRLLNGSEYRAMRRQRSHGRSLEPETLTGTIITIPLAARLPRSTHLVAAEIREGGEARIFRSRRPSRCLG